MGRAAVVLLKTVASHPSGSGPLLNNGTVTQKATGAGNICPQNGKIPNSFYGGQQVKNSTWEQEKQEQRKFVSCGLFESHREQKIADRWSIMAYRSTFLASSRVILASSRVILASSRVILTSSKIIIVYRSLNLAPSSIILASRRAILVYSSKFLPYNSACRGHFKGFYIDWHYFLADPPANPGNIKMT